MNKATVYLGFAVLGAIIPYLFFIDFAQQEGIHIGAFVTALFANGAVGGFTADLVISSLVFWIFMFSKKEGPNPVVFVLLNCSIGLSCALPAYFWAVEKAKTTSS